MRRFLLILILLTGFHVEAFAADGGNSNNLFIKKKINDRWSWVSRSLTVSRDDMSDFFFGTADLGLRYQLSQRWSVDMVYRAAWLELGDHWRFENRPLINLNYTTNLAGYRFDHRSRAEFRIFDSAPDDIRYRGEFRLIGPWEFTRWRIKPYLEEEFFYSVNQQRVNENWLSGGLRYKVRPNTVVKLGYRWQTQKFGDDWRHRHVLVTGLLFFF